MLKGSGGKTELFSDFRMELNGNMPKDTMSHGFKNCHVIASFANRQICVLIVFHKARNSYKHQTVNHWEKDHYASLRLHTVIRFVLTSLQWPEGADRQVFCLLSSITYKMHLSAEQLSWFFCYIICNNTASGTAKPCL